MGDARRRPGAHRGVPGRGPRGLRRRLADDRVLVEWFIDGHRALVAALRSAPEDLVCWTLLPAPTARAFWIRRQAHETAVHGVDAALAAGRAVDLEPAFAADGLDELLLGFVARYRRRLSAESPRELVLRADDSGDARAIELDESGSSVHRGAGPDGGRLRSETRGSASALYRWAWRRARRHELEVEGDDAPLRLFEETVHVTWSWLVIPRPHEPRGGRLGAESPAAALVVEASLRGNRAAGRSEAS